MPYNVFVNNQLNEKGINDYFHQTSSQFDHLRRIEMDNSLEELKNLSNLEQVVLDELIAELKEQHNEQMNMVLFHPEVYKYLTRKQYKKIKRRIFYEVIWWSSESRNTKCFYSAKKMRSFVNNLHSYLHPLSDDAYIQIEKTWSYRDFSPRHKWYYVSFKPNHFLLMEKY